MDVESLYPLVTEAIRRAEVLADLNAPGVRSAHLDVSLLEERIAGFLPASDPEGAIARRGAVRAAIEAHEFQRARQLADQFTSQDGVSDALRATLHQLADEASKLALHGSELIAMRYPRASARFGIDEIRRVAQQFSGQGAPFPIC